MDERTDGRVRVLVDGWLAGCMDGWRDGWIDEWMNGWMYGWMDRQTDRQTDKQTGGRTDGHYGKIDKLCDRVADWLERSACNAETVRVRASPVTITV